MSDRRTDNQKAASMPNDFCLSGHATRWDGLSWHSRDDVRKKLRPMVIWIKVRKTRECESIGVRSHGKFMTGNYPLPSDSLVSVFNLQGMISAATNSGY